MQEDVGRSVGGGRIGRRSVGGALGSRIGSQLSLIDTACMAVAASSKAAAAKPTENDSAAGNKSHVGAIAIHVLVPVVTLALGFVLGRKFD